jgi:hypothetical protein
MDPLVMLNFKKTNGFYHTARIYVLFVSIKTPTTDEKLDTLVVYARLS